MKNKSKEFLEYIEEQEQASDLPTVEGYYENESNNQDWYDYMRINLSELEDEEEYWGRPYLTDIETKIYDEDQGPRHRCRLLIIDDDNEEYLQININLKTADNVQTNVHSASSLYALVAGLQNLQDPKWSSRYNRIRKVNVEDYQKYINGLEEMNVKVETKDGSNFSYNSFKIVKTK